MALIEACNAYCLACSCFCGALAFVRRRKKYVEQFYIHRVCWAFVSMPAAVHYSTYRNTIENINFKITPATQIIHRSRCSERDILVLSPSAHTDIDSTAQHRHDFHLEYYVSSKFSSIATSPPLRLSSPTSLSEAEPLTSLFDRVHHLASHRLQTGVVAQVELVEAVAHEYGHCSHPGA